VSLLQTHRPLAIDLYCGLGGWSEALLAEGFDVVGFDIEQHVYGEDRYPGQLVIQDALTLHGRQFKDAALLVASPPCTEYSYMAMPWSRAKAIAKALRGEGEFPDGYKGSRTVTELTRLFDACFRIQREASAAANRHIPLVVENVKGAQPWVGRAAWNFGSFYLWGDVPALMPVPMRAVKASGHSMSQGAPKWNMHHAECVEAAIGIKNDGGSWFNIAHNTTSGHARNPVHEGVKHGGEWFHDPASPGRQGGLTGTKQPGIAGVRANGKGDRWFQDGAARHGSKSSARKAASARIAKIPFALAQHIARCYRHAEAA
jgi:hypothetical protein